MKKMGELISLLFINILCLGQQRSISLLSAETKGIDINKKPYLTRYSLGEELDTEGIEVKLRQTSEIISAEDLKFSNFNADDLGKQTVLVGYQSYSTSFDIFVTNRHVTNYLPTSEEIIISEVSLFRDKVSVELFNGTIDDVELNNYSLLVNEDTTISFWPTTVKSKHTFILDCNTNPNISFEGFTTLSLIKSNKRLDSFSKYITEGLTREEEGTFIRNRHIFSPNAKADSSEWIYVKDKNNTLGKHVVTPALVDTPNQSKAFARYVMFGAGMFAAGRVEEAFLSLQDEYNFMSIDSQKYFSTNKDVKVTGINESGRSVTVTFNEAHKRIELLAAKSNNKSFVLSFNTKSEINKNMIIIVGFIVAILFFYIMGVFLFKKNRTS